MATSIKISQLPAKGANLEATDLLEVSEFNGTGYVSKSITGQEIIDASAGGGGVTDITVNAPLSTTGGTTPDLAISEADASTDGFITAVDWNTFNDKQDELVSGTNIKTINGSSVLGSGDLVVSGGSGLQGVHTILPIATGNQLAIVVNSQSVTTVNSISNRLYAIPFIPNRTFTTSNLYINVTTLGIGVNGRILIYSDLNGKPDTKIYESSNLDCSTLGIKTATTSQTFTAGTTYWICTQYSGIVGTTAYSGISLLILSANGAQTSSSYFITPTFGSAPTTFGAGSLAGVNISAVFITAS
jgi:hypothetical protein